MELAEGRSLALAMMTEHGLIAKGWSFAFDRAKSRLGRTWFNSKTITMSAYVVAYATPHQVKQLMLHEIAHALLPVSAGHGREWKAKAASIGYRGQRTAANPYLEAMRSAGTPVKRNAPRKPAPRKQVLVPIPPNPGIVVGIGTTIRVPKGRAVIFKKGRTRWHAKTSSGKVWTIPFHVAHVYAVS